MKVFETKQKRRDLMGYLALYAFTGFWTYLIVPKPKDISRTTGIIDGWTFWHMVYGFIGQRFGQSAMEHFTLGIGNEVMEFCLRGRATDQFLMAHEPLTNAIIDISANMLGWKLGEHIK